MRCGWKRVLFYSCGNDLITNRLADLEIMQFEVFIAPKVLEIICMSLAMSGGRTSQNYDVI